MNKRMVCRGTFAKVEGYVLAAAVALPILGLALAPTSAASQDKPFGTMATAPDVSDECVAPRPPSDLAATAYVRNGYRAILRIMAGEKWQDTGSCACFLTQISWDEVIARSGDFTSLDDARRPFDVSDLRLRADALLAARDAACAA
jgi:hypothetical protein